MPTLRGRRPKLGSVPPPRPTTCSAPEQTQAPSHDVQVIKLTALRLEELLMGAAPRGSRLDRAIDAIRAGVRLALDMVAEGETAGSLKDLK